MGAEGVPPPPPVVGTMCRPYRRPPPSWKGTPAAAVATDAATAVAATAVAAAGAVAVPAGGAPPVAAAQPTAVAPPQPPPITPPAAAAITARNRSPQGPLPCGIGCAALTDATAVAAAVAARGGRPRGCPPSAPRPRSRLMAGGTRRQRQRHDIVDRRWQSCNAYLTIIFFFVF